MQDKTKAKKRYLKRKKDRRKNRKSAAPKKSSDPPTTQPEVDDSDGSSSSEGSDADVAINAAPKDSLEQTISEEPEVLKRPKKRRKVAEVEGDEVGSDVEMQEATQTPVYGTSELAIRRLPSPLAALPSFPLPALPNAPSKSVLALQGLDQALVDAEIVDPKTLLPIPSDGDDDAGTGLTEKTRKRLNELGIVELFAGLLMSSFLERTLIILLVQTALLPFLLPSNRFQRSLYLPYDPPRDVCASAPTGSGKTLAYVLPIIEVRMYTKVSKATPTDKATM